MHMGACFDASGAYRYRLWREWQPDAGCIAFVMLNPSTADGSRHDPTIRRCLQFAQAWGYGGLQVVNLFAYRTPHPQLLSGVADPVGPDNDRHLLTACDRAQMVLLGWGNRGMRQQRDQAVLAMLAAYPLYCLGLTQLGHPRHPLYVQGDRQPLPFAPAP